MDFSEDLAKLKAITPRLSRPERYSERRPWGGFDRFVQNEMCSVKILTIQPGEALSAQSHDERSEWWIILDEKMDVEVDGIRKTAYRGEDIFISPKVEHRVYGLEKPCRWLEITFGVNDENDIHRYEDKYGRVEHTKT